MHIRLIAVGDRQPSWVNDAFKTYAERFPRQWKFRIDKIATARRSKNNPPNNAIQAEGEQILAKIDVLERAVLLDEKGMHLTSQELAMNLSDWQAGGRNLCFIIGGPDGVSAGCRERSDFVWSMSKLTLPHGLARILFAEQLFRAWSLLTGHPYHRG